MLFQLNQFFVIFIKIIIIIQRTLIHLYLHMPMWKFIYLRRDRVRGKYVHFLRSPSFLLTQMQTKLKTFVSFTILLTLIFHAIQFITLMMLLLIFYANAI